MKANLALLVHFFKVTTVGSFQNELSVLEIKVRSFLERLIRMDVSALKSICKTMKKKGDTGTKVLEETIYPRSRDSFTKEICNKQI